MEKTIFSKNLQFSILQISSVKEVQLSENLVHQKIFRETGWFRETYKPSSILEFETEFNRKVSKIFEHNVNTDFYAPSWTFKSKKVFYCVRNISVFLNCCWSLTEKNWKFLRKRLTRVAKTAFYVCRGTIFRKTIFLGKLFSFHFLIVKEKIMTPAKDFSEGCLKRTLRFQLIAFTMKTFSEILLLLQPFRTSSGKNFQLSTYTFCKAVIVHSTYSDELFQGKKFF